MNIKIFNRKLIEESLWESTLKSPIFDIREAPKDTDWGDLEEDMQYQITEDEVEKLEFGDIVIVGAVDNMDNGDEVIGNHHFLITKKRREKIGSNARDNLYDDNYDTSLIKKNVYGTNLFDLDVLDQKDNSEAEQAIDKSNKDAYETVFYGRLLTSGGPNASTTNKYLPYRYSSIYIDNYSSMLKKPSMITKPIGIELGATYRAFTGDIIQKVGEANTEFLNFVSETAAKLIAGEKDTNGKKIWWEKGLTYDIKPEDKSKEDSKDKDKSEQTPEEPTCPVSEDELIKLVLTKSLSDIAKDYSTEKSTLADKDVKTWLRNFNLPVKRVKYIEFNSKYPDKWMDIIKIYNDHPEDWQKELGIEDKK